MVEWVVLNDKSRIKEIAGLTVNWLRELIKNPQVIAASPYLPVAVAAWDAGNDSVSEKCAGPRHRHGTQGGHEWYWWI